MKKLGEDMPTKKNNQNKDLFIENVEIPIPKSTEDLFGLTNKNKKVERENEITWLNRGERKEKEEYTENTVKKIMSYRLKI